MEGSDAPCERCEERKGDRVVMAMQSWMVVQMVLGSAGVVSRRLSSHLTRSSVLRHLWRATGRLSAFQGDRDHPRTLLPASEVGVGRIRSGT